MIEARIAHIGDLLQAIKPGWSYLMAELDAREQELTGQLVNNDNEQTRGRIKCLREIRDLPATLQYEREGMQSALSNQDAAE